MTANTRFDVQSPQVPVTRIPRSLYVSAGERLVGVGAGAGTRRSRAKRFVQSAPQFGIDLANMWGTVDPKSGRVREVCLGVPSPGRTAMLFVSGQEAGVDAAGRALERAECIEATSRQLAANPPDGYGLRLAQALLEAEEEAIASSLVEAGFTSLGELAYLRRPVRPAPVRPTLLPEGFELRTIDSIPPDQADDLVASVLAQTYVDTLDCPELCGMRSSEDVIESHRAVGTYDPSLWWVVRSTDPSMGDDQFGCLLMNPSPDQDSIELVYLGLSPRLRGLGLGRALLDHGLRAVASRPESHVTCAVDTRNAPAMSLYRGAGFARFSSRHPFVRAIRP